MKQPRNKQVSHQSIRHTLMLVMCLLVTLSAVAQRYPFHNLNVDDGLIQSQATSLTQDSAGNLWVGTFGGLSRYDGRTFTNYTVRNGLPSNTVWALAVDRQDNIWVGTQSGLSQFNGKGFVNYSRSQQSRTINTTQQIQIAGDTTWWRVQGEVYFVTRGKIKYYVTPGIQALVSAIQVDHEGIWIAKDSILYHQYNKKTDSFKFHLAAGLRQPVIHALYTDKDHALWIATDAGLYKTDHNSLVQFAINGLPDPNLHINAVAQDRAGALWLATTSGVLKITGNTVQYYNKHNGLSDNAFLAMLTDAEGNIWMGSNGQGVYRFSGTQFAGLDESMGLPSAQIMALAYNRRDSLFLGTYDAGLYIFSDGNVSPLSFPTNPVPSITSLCYTHGKLWIGTQGRGLWSYQGGIFRQYEAPDRNFPSNQVQCLYEDQQKRLWIGFADGAMVLENDTFKTIVPDKVPVHSFLSIGDNKILIGTENRLLLYDNGEVSEYKTNTLLDSSSVHVQCFTLQGKYLWLGSSDNGVIRYNMETGKALVINKASGLRSDFIYNIIADNDGNIWAGTGFGIHKITMNELDEPQISFYGKAQGITGMESNINAVIKLPDGSIWFGTTNGALHYQPHTAVVSSSPISITMQSVKLAGEAVIDPSYYDSTDSWYGVPYRLQLPYKKNNISFTFQAVTLSGAQQVVYRYRMDGLEAPWSDWSATNSVTYSALPPGKYTLHVQCKGPDGQATPELTYAFEIITPFQKTMWFRLAVLIASLLCGILLQYIVNSRKQRRLRLLEKLRSEELSKIRMRTAEDFHDEIGNKLTRINVLASVLKNKVPLTPDTERILGQIEDNTAQLYSGTRDILWSLKPSNDNLYEIIHRIRDFAGELFQDTDVNFTFTGTDEKWRNHKLPMDMSRNLIMIFKEALNNCLKYSKAKNVSLEVHLRNRDVLQLVLKDDGLGFNIRTIQKGNGIINMNTRTERLNGKLYIDSRAGKGTIISLTFKIPRKR
jgi:ligand-binding sensor domain-containing protein/signal transduction histidine kinase